MGPLVPEKPGVQGSAVSCSPAGGASAQLLSENEERGSSCYVVPFTREQFSQKTAFRTGLDVLLEATTQLVGSLNSEGVQERAERTAAPGKGPGPEGSAAVCVPSVGAGDGGGGAVDVSWPC